MRGPLDVSRELLQAEVLHEIVHLPRRIDDVAELPEVLGVPRTACVAVRLYVAGRLVATLVPAGAVPTTAALTGSALSRWIEPLSDPARVSALTDCHPALVPPVGLPSEAWVVADTALAGHEVVFTPTGDGSTALKIRSDDLLAFTGAVTARLVDPRTTHEVVPRTAETRWRDDRLPLYSRS